MVSVNRKKSWPTSSISNSAWSIVIGQATWNFSRMTSGPSPSMAIGTRLSSMTSVSGATPLTAGMPSADGADSPAAALLVLEGLSGAVLLMGTDPAGTGPGAGRLPAGRAGAGRRGGGRVPALAPVTAPPQPGLQLRQGHVQRREAILGRGLGPDGRPAGGDGQLDALLAPSLTGVVLRRDLDVDPDRLVVELLHLGKLARRVLPELLQHVGVPAFEDDVHVHRAPSGRSNQRHPPGRPGLLPHIRLLRGSRRACATTALLPARAMSDRPAGQDLPLSRTVIGRREVALRGPFCLRLASASPAGRPKRTAGPAQPRTRAGAMT